MAKRHCSCVSSLALCFVSTVVGACGSSNSAGEDASATGPSTEGTVDGVRGSNAQSGGASPSMATGGSAVGGGGSAMASGGSSTGGSRASGGTPDPGGNDAGIPTGGVSSAGTGGSDVVTPGGRDSGGGSAGTATSGNSGAPIGGASNASAAGAAGSSSGGEGPTATGGSGTGGSEWPECYADGQVPSDDAELKQRAPASEYTSQYTFGGLAMLIGDERPTCLTDDVVERDLRELNQGIIDIVEVLGFPAFPDWENGYYLNWVILNSGIPGATLSGEGGHQGDRWGHMNFESTQDCPCTWDEYNSGAALHECIHALQAELWAFNNQASGWVHEAHNCYLGTMREQLAHDKYTMGYGAAAALQMPNVPIESMGLNTDDSVAGPSDQNAKTYVNSIVRYGLEIFFLSLNLERGRGFINCIWMDAAADGDAATRTSGRKSVFQALQSYGGEEAAAQAVLAFGARSSLLDFGPWTNVVRTTLKDNWNNSYWFYMFPDGDGTTQFSPPAKLVPHHQGRNIIPIVLDDDATSVTVELTPDARGDGGTPEHMQGQLTYRTPEDQPVYGTPFSSGQSTIEVPNGARNDIVNLVVAVTNPSADSGGDDGSGKGFDAQEHFNYTARIVRGGRIAPTSVRPW